MSEIKKTRSEQKREAIIDASVNAFQSFGVKETSMDKIAELAQVSKRTVYNHFASKEILVTEILSMQWQDAIIANDINYQKNIALDVQLKSLLDAELILLENNEFIEMVRVALGYFIHQSELMCEYSEQFLKAETALKRWINAAVKDKRLKQVDVDLANDYLVNFLKGQAFWPQILNREPPLSKLNRQRLIDDVTGMFLAYYQI